MKRQAVFIAAFFVLSALAAATTAAQGPTVVASTAWTAAYARAAGAAEVIIIAPLELRHPPEYEIKPSDLEKVRGANLVVFAGYEKFAQKLAETAGGEQVQLLQVVTDNTPENIKAQARLIAETLGTVPACEEWAKDFDALATQVRADVQRAYPNRKAVVHNFQRSFVEWLGFEVVGEFGPAEPSPAVIADLVRQGPLVVIDNYHNPVGQPIAESARAGYAQLINFPGKDGTITIEDVYRHNTQALIMAAGQKPAAGGVNWALIGGLAAVGVVLIGGLAWLLWRRA
jgi:hypothetical protein